MDTNNATDTTAVVAAYYTAFLPTVYNPQQMSKRTTVTAAINETFGFTKPSAVVTTISATTDAPNTTAYFISIETTRRQTLSVTFVVSNYWSDFFAQNF